MADVTTILVALLGSAVISAVVSHRGELARVREARRQARLAATYLDVIESTLRAEAWVERTVPFMSRSTDPGRPGLPSDDEQLKLAVRVIAYGSPQMQGAFQAVTAAQHEFVEALRRYDELLRNPPPAPTEAENQEATFKAFDDVRRNRLRPAVQALLALANAELAERHAGWLARLRTRQRRPSKLPKSGKL